MAKKIGELIPKLKRPLRPIPWYQRLGHFLGQKVGITMDQGYGKCLEGFILFVLFHVYAFLSGSNISSYDSHKLLVIPRSPKCPMDPMVGGSLATTSRLEPRGSTLPWWGGSHGIPKPCCELSLNGPLAPIWWRQGAQGVRGCRQQNADVA